MISSSKLAEILKLALLFHCSFFVVGYFLWNDSAKWQVSTGFSLFLILLKMLASISKLGHEELVLL